MQTNLYYREGNSDKVYQVSIDKYPDGHRVSASWGRRGSTLQTAVKTSGAVLLNEARKVHDRLVAAKEAKGYTREESGTPYRSSGDEGRDTGFRCQLLNPIPEDEVEEILSDSRYLLQEKFDGVRMMIRKTGDDVIGINRRGLQVALPGPILEAVLAHPFDFLIDGEAVGDVIHVFDLLELEGRDLRDRPYMDRYLELLRFFEPSEALKPVAAADTFEQRKKLVESLRERGAEGVVFKDRFAPFTPGRPSSGGSQRKFKFVTSASFIVSAINRQRSVALALLDGKEERPAGNVTIPPNYEVPAASDIVEVRYLYAFRQSGCIYQPVYLGKRDDLDRSDCQVAQLRYKDEAKAVA